MLGNSKKIPKELIKYTRVHEIVKNKSLFKHNFNLREWVVNRIEFESTNPSLTKNTPNPTLTKT